MGDRGHGRRAAPPRASRRAGERPRGAGGVARRPRQDAASLVLGGVLARRAEAADLADLAARERAADRPRRRSRSTRSSRCPADADWARAVETIDVGGVTLLRAAAKNCATSPCCPIPRQYEACASALAAHGGVPWELRRDWARAAFERTARYDAAIAAAYGAHAAAEDDARTPRPAGDVVAAYSARARCATARTRTRTPRSTSRAAAAAPGAGGFDAVARGEGTLVQQPARPRGGERARRRVRRPGVRRSSSTTSRRASRAAPRRAEAFERAFEADALSAFGGIVAFNVEVDARRRRRAGAAVPRVRGRAVVHRRPRSRCWRRRRTCASCAPRRVPRGRAGEARATRPRRCSSRASAPTRPALQLWSSAAARRRPRRWRRCCSPGRWSGARARTRSSSPRRPHAGHRLGPDQPHRRRGRRAA